LQGMGAVRQRVNQQAQAASAVSGLGQQGFISRMSDAVRDATPETSIKDSMGAGLNVVPQNKIPNLPGMPKLGEYAEPHADDPFLKIAEDAPGIPSRKDYGDLKKVR